MFHRDSKNIVFTSCDSRYFMEHGICLVKSCLKIDQPIHVHVIEPSDRAYEVLEQYSSEKINFMFSAEWDIGQRKRNRTYYACSRFLELPDILLRYQESNVLVVDTDSYFLRPFPFPENKEVGVFLREPSRSSNDWEARGMRIAAGIVYVTQDALSFTQNVKNRIEEMGVDRWFTDQVALYEAFEEEYSDKPDLVYDFQLCHHDWEFHDDSYMWSGKGPRKNSNRRYIDMKRLIENA